MNSQGIELDEDSGLNHVRSCYTAYYYYKNNGEYDWAYYILNCMDSSVQKDSLDLDKIKIKLKNGFIAVDDEQNTKVEGIYALGDVTNNNHTV